MGSRREKAERASGAEDEPGRALGSWHAVSGYWMLSMA